MLELQFLPFWGVIAAFLATFSRVRFSRGRVVIPLWALLGAASVVAALAIESTYIIGWKGAVWLVILSMATLLYHYVPFEGPRKRWIKEGAYLLVLVLSYQLLCHRMPGFGEVPVYTDMSFGTSIFTASLDVYFDKAMAGLIMFGILVRPIRGWAELRLACWRARYAPLLMIVVYAIGVMAWLGFDVKFNQYVVWYWLSSLFFVCVLQEIFFRLLIQRRLEAYIGGTGSETVYLAAVITAVVYTVTHLNSLIPIPEMPLVFLSGLLFGYVYAATRRVELSILFHLLYSGLSMMLFDYP